jgi:lipoic acid synthetase
MSELHESLDFTPTTDTLSKPIAAAPSPQLRKPEWLKITAKRGDDYQDIKKNMRKRGLHTVCEEASCPNLNECWSQRTATIMILGDVCTRGCRFCHIKTGNPAGLLNLKEIANASEMVEMMNLRYIVLTSVDRDDLADHGAGHFANVIRRIHKDHPDTKVEALVPDFDAIPAHMDVLAAAKPFVVAQNMETVKRLTHKVRDIRAGYEKTLQCLDYYKQQHGMRTKTSLMVGLGETMAEIEECLDDLRAVGTDIVTFGQYLQPTKKHLRVEKYYTPEEFKILRRVAYKKGFQFVASGPMVRSSYKAADFLEYLGE